ncbi:two component, sigma54 specific, transcriptional regulator, Fis family [Geobacter metallireducens RCH3]|uniref:Sigma-54-dependent transcriptional response regulator n=1 Tax=Geobacter metallireducens (strain ATCC 53774 / DSM 7210 / GS-15) TaxID=269799 RepID=Q39SU6_GEOMG|nr:sigma-54 dependent transcriptional regulator [Geobacter metallireducens]ABB32678.1 sigma-54-dependent transcriptional response regulator [Geobacter metallireducens GS-15]EHP87829.1 two component, sigma54 specific, transcriptional regulator, Fis family [Geobacter metallireducens RCH3]
MANGEKKTVRVLIVDDDVSLRRVLEYNLQEEGYEVLTAGSGEEGLRLFEDGAPTLVVTDLKMPGMGGFQLLREVKERFPDTVVIVITAFGAVEAAVEAMKAGAYDFITKPFNREALKLTVRKALDMQGLSRENRRLREELSEREEFRSIIGISPPMEEVFRVIDRVADTDATVLITGESGTGKELVARAIHNRSSRRAAPFVAINCAAIPRDLLESELFGHVKGAFTGAVQDKEGKFRQAEAGTLFLDEVGELPVELQSKLLRALQEKEVQPVGGAHTIKLDVRVVAATNADLEEAIAEGRFREDLFYRLSVIPVHLPPLRERKEDIPLLVRHFAAKHGGASVTFSPEILAVMAAYGWPGNVRELENTVERILIMRNADTIHPDDLPEKVRRGRSPQRECRVINLPDEGYSLEQLEREIVVEALERNNWNQSSAARFLRIPRHTLIYRMEKYSITTPERKK